MDSQSLMCLDWILASTEYIEFVYMMLEFKQAQDWMEGGYAQAEEGAGEEG
jgi:hypothetical protein